jgi:ATP-dependent phosphofructokinase / diphosphate-dependent phosphofructokinase
MPVDGKVVDRTDEAVETYRRHHLDVLVCLGGRETQDTQPFMLMQRGLNVITLPKAIDNDIAETETTVGFDTAVGIAAEAIDRVHATALSNHRILDRGDHGAQRRLARHWAPALPEAQM